MIRYHLNVTNVLPIPIKFLALMYRVFKQPKNLIVNNCRYKFDANQDIFFHPKAIWNLVFLETRIWNLVQHLRSFLLQTRLTNAFTNKICLSSKNPHKERKYWIRHITLGPEKISRKFVWKVLNFCSSLKENVFFKAANVILERVSRMNWEIMCQDISKSCASGSLNGISFWDLSIPDSCVHMFLEFHLGLYDIFSSGNCSDSKYLMLDITRSLFIITPTLLLTLLHISKQKKIKKSSTPIP